MPDSFETQVAEALTKAMFDAQEAGGKPLWPETMMPYLAPRVAAAIEAAIREAQGTTSTPFEPRVMNLPEDARDAAVWALRGETP